MKRGIVALAVLLVIAIGITGSVWDWNGSVATVITWPIWNASPENQWYSLIWPNLPTWLTVSNRDALAGFFMGETNPYQAWILRAWIQPAFWWTAWATALIWVSFCLNVIVRKRWSEEEQLPFPMTTLPLQISQEKEGLLQRRQFSHAEEVDSRFMRLPMQIVRVRLEFRGKEPLDSHIETETNVIAIEHLAALVREELHAGAEIRLAHIEILVKIASPDLLESQIRRRRPMEQIAQFQVRPDVGRAGALG